MTEAQGNASTAPLRLRKRADFLRARQGKTAHGRGLVLQAVRQLSKPHDADHIEMSPPGGPNLLGDSNGRAETMIAEHPGSQLAARPRFGFTVSKRCGEAVRRNRIRRRLKEAVRLLKPLPARPGYDYVIVARPEALGMAFPALQAELLRAFGKILTLKSPSKFRDDREGLTVHSTGKPRHQSPTGRTSKK